jgi:hypothetical protein
MIDINNIINTVIAAAVAEATKPLVERIAALETKLAEAALFERTTEVTIPVDEAKMVEALNSQEWFWEKVRRFADGAVEQAIDNHEEGMSHFDEDDIDTKIDNAIDNHEENRTHGDDDDIEEIVQKLLNSASISITV